MKIRYWTMPFATKLTPLSPPRELDERVLVEAPLADFIYDAIYGNSNQYGPKEQSAQYVLVKAYDLLAEIGVLTVEKLREILSTAYSLSHPGTALSYRSIESIVP